MSEKKLIDDAFYIQKKPYDLWDSSDKEGKGIVTSLTEQSCIDATRFILKHRQESFSNSIIDSSEVNEKL